MLIVLPQLVFIPMSFVTASIFNNLRVHHVIYCCCIAQLIGCWLRYLAFMDESLYSLLFVGTFIYVLALPAALNGVSLIANLWFPDHQRATATGLMGVSMALGSVVGLVISGVISAGLDKTDQQSCFNTIKRITFI